MSPLPTAAPARPGAQQRSGYRRRSSAVPDRPPMPRSARPLDPARALDPTTVTGPQGGLGVSDGAPTDADSIVGSWEDPAHFAEVFDRHYDAIHRFLWTRVGRRAEDLTAEVFKIAFQQRDRYDPDYPSAKPWLFGIAARLAKQQHREEAQAQEAASRMGSEPAAVTQSSPEHRLHELAPSSSVAHALMQLPARDREPLLLHVWDDLSYDDVARVLDIPLGTVRSRIHRAREDLRVRLAVDGDRDAQAPGGVHHG